MRLYGLIAALEVREVELTPGVHRPCSATGTIILAIAG
jgi:hypothetical protein